MLAVSLTSSNRMPVAPEHAIEYFCYVWQKCDGVYSVDRAYWEMEVCEEGRPTLDRFMNSST